MQALSLDLTPLSDEELEAQLGTMVGHSRRITAQVLVHLAEVERRKLFAARAKDSLFAYCTDELGYDSGAAYYRIRGARVVRRFSQAAHMVADGRLHLAGLTLLSPYLTEDNHAELFAAASGKSKRNLERLLAERFPKPDVPAQVKKLRAPRSKPAPSQREATGAPGPPAEAASKAADPRLGSESQRQPPTAPAVAVPDRRRAEVSPLSAQRYKVQFTASQELVDALREARELLSHQLPDGDVAEIIERGLLALCKQLRKRKYAETDKPRSLASSGARKADQDPPRTGASRHIPAHVKREVHARDGGCCTFEDGRGKRCRSRHRLEYHHIEPHALGGQATVHNTTLRCQTHNAFAVIEELGSDRAQALIQEAQAERSRRQCHAGPAARAEATAWTRHAVSAGAPGGSVVPGSPRRTQLGLI